MTTDDAAELRGQLAELREEMAEGFAALDRRLTELARAAGWTPPGGLEKRDGCKGQPL